MNGDIPSLLLQSSETLRPIRLPRDLGEAKVHASLGFDRPEVLCEWGSSLNLMQEYQWHLHHSLRNRRSRCVGICQLDVESQKQSHKQAFQLVPSKALTNARSWSMQEGDLAICSACPAVARLSLAHPAVWIELARIVAPDRRETIDRPWTYDDVRTLGEDLVLHRRLAHGLSQSQRNRRKKSQDLIRNSVEVVHGVKNSSVDGLSAPTLGHVLLDVLPETVLYVFVHGEQVRCPRKSRRGSGNGKSTSEWV